MNLARSGGILFMLGALALPASAHHSYSMFDMANTVELDATIVQFKWQNPHAFIHADIRSPNGEERWAIEMTSPNVLVQEGWTRRTLSTGDRVTLYVHPLRSGAQGASYVGVRLQDGSTLGDVE